MRVDCEAPRNQRSERLIEDIKLLGVNPIVTDTVVRAVHEGSVGVGVALIDRFKREPQYGFVADYEKNEQPENQGKKRKKRR